MPLANICEPAGALESMDQRVDGARCLVRLHPDARVYTITRS